MGPVGSVGQGGLRRCPTIGQRRLFGRRVQIQVGEYFLDDRGVFDAGDHFDGAAADTAGLYVNVEHAFEALRPTHGRVTFPRRCLRG